MAENSVELVRLRNNFYRDNYRRVMKLLFVLSVIIVFLLVVIGYLLKNQPTPKYFATTQSGRIIQVIPLNDPMVSSEALLNWASQIATAAYSYSFVDYREKIQALEPSFTGNGWQEFLRRLKESGNIEAIEQRRMIVSAVVASTPIIVHQGMLDGRYAWKVQVPISATFVVGGKQVPRGYLVTMTIIRVPTLQNVNGVAVAQFIAE